MAKNIVIQEAQTRIVLTPQGGCSVQRYQANTGWIVDNDIHVLRILKEAVKRLEHTIPLVAQIESAVPQ